MQGESLDRKNGNTIVLGVAMENLYNDKSRPMWESKTNNIHSGHFARFSMQPSTSQLNQLQIYKNEYIKRCLAGDTKATATARNHTIEGIYSGISTFKAGAPPTDAEIIAHDLKLRDAQNTNAYYVMKALEKKLKIGQGRAKCEGDEALNAYTRGAGKLVLFRVKDVDEYRRHKANLIAMSVADDTSISGDGASDAFDLVKLSIRPFETIKNREQILVKRISYDLYLRAYKHWQIESLKHPVERTLEKFERAWIDLDFNEEKKKKEEEDREEKAAVNALSGIYSSTTAADNIKGGTKIEESKIFVTAEEIAREAAETGVITMMVPTETTAEIPLVVKDAPGAGGVKRKGNFNQDTYNTAGGAGMRQGYVCKICGIPGHKIHDCPMKGKRQRTAEDELLGRHAPGGATGPKAHRPKVNQTIRLITGRSPCDYRVATEEDMKNPDLAKGYFASNPQCIVVDVARAELLASEAKMSPYGAGVLTADGKRVADRPMWNQTDDVLRRRRGAFA
jgi:hypothetical protein